MTSAHIVRLGALALAVFSMACEPAFAAKKYSHKPKPDIARPDPAAKRPAVPPKQIQSWGTGPL